MHYACWIIEHPNVFSTQTHFINLYTYKCAAFKSFVRASVPCHFSSCFFKPLYILGTHTQWFRINCSVYMYVSCSFMKNDFFFNWNYHILVILSWHQNVFKNKAAKHDVINGCIYCSMVLSCRRILYAARLYTAETILCYTLSQSSFFREIIFILIEWLSHIYVYKYKHSGHLIKMTTGFNPQKFPLTGFKNVWLTKRLSRDARIIKRKWLIVMNLCNLKSQNNNSLIWTWHDLTNMRSCIGFAYVYIFFFLVFNFY